MCTAARTRSVRSADTAGLGPAAVADIPPHPDQLEFPDLDFTPPRASDFREELPDGVPLYMAPSHELPLVTIAFSFRGSNALILRFQLGNL